MTDHFDAFEISPVPAPGADAVAPEPYRGLYGMPAFATLTTDDLAASVRFWTDGLGFFDLFTIPGRLTHLRRWAFQDVLLVPADGERPAASSVTLSFAAVLQQIEAIAAACRSVDPDCVKSITDTPWNTRDLLLRTPEGARVIITAARPFDPESEAGRNLRAVGIGVNAPSSHNGPRD